MRRRDHFITILPKVACTLQTEVEPNPLYNDRLQGRVVDGGCVALDRHHMCCVMRNGIVTAIHGVDSRCVLLFL